MKQKPGKLLFYFIFIANWWTDATSLLMFLNRDCSDGDQQRPVDFSELGKKFTPYFFTSPMATVSINKWLMG